MSPSITRCVLVLCVLALARSTTELATRECI